MVVGHGAGVEAVFPAMRSAADVMTLNVEPGGYAPSSARSNPWSGLETTARIWPVGMSMATSAAGGVTAATPRSDAACVGPAFLYTVAASVIGADQRFPRGLD